ncbi:MAG: hypothetical protein EXR69_10990 [Myxococcales bacterium]|nr:hypothetical protein [Myxococcales bacterium]
MVMRVVGGLLALFGLLCMLATGVAWMAFGFDKTPMLIHSVGGVGLFLIALWLVLDWKNLAAIGRDQTVGRAAMASLIVVVLAGIAVGINVVAFRYDKRWDLTKGQQFTLSEQSKELARGLDREVLVYAFFQSGSPQDSNFKNLMQGYVDETRLLKVEYHDPYSNPLLAEQMKIISASGTVIVKVGENQQRLESDFDEEAFTNALVKVKSDKSHSVCVVQGHGELDYTDDQSPNGLGVALQRLEGQNYKTSQLSLLDTQPEPATCEIVVVTGPRVELLPIERDRLARYAAAGGGLMVMLDPLQTPETAADMARYGLKIGNDVVVEGDPSRQVMANDATALGLDSMSWNAHPVTQKLTGLVVLSLARSVTKGDDIPGLNVQVIAHGSESGWGETQLTDPEKPAQPDEGVDLIGNVGLIATIDISDPSALRTTSEALAVSPDAPAALTTAPTAIEAPALKAGGKVMVFGDGDFASNLLILKVQNQDLFLNTAAWMVGEKDQLAVRANSAAKGKLELSELSVFGGGALGLLVIPGCCIAGMIGTWMLRRGK